MRLHMLGLPHTRPQSEFSHCAYTGKVMRFGPMMAAEGFDVVHYGVGEPETKGWADHVPVLSESTQEELLGYDPLVPSPEFVGRSTDVSSPLYVAFNSKLATLLRQRVTGDDIICLPFGHGHQAAIGGLEQHAVETGIGYPTCILGYRIYESYAWLHWHLGKEGRQAWTSEWVVPNYFDPDEWPLRQTPPSAGEYVLYFGRITGQKGLNVVWSLAEKRPDLTFVLCGQGDPAPWMVDRTNIVYHPPVHGRERAALMHRAKCLVMPTEYLEPFGGVAVEAMLTGTPVLTSNQGAFAETVPAWARCNTEKDWLTALDTALTITRPVLSRTLALPYLVENIGPRYTKIFEQIPSIRTHGWHNA